MLPKPSYIAKADIAHTSTRYLWNEWNVVAAYQPANPELMSRMSKLSHRANVAMCTAMAEWVVWRFEKLSTDVEPYQYIEAAWASGVHRAYARYVEFDDDDWRGIIRGPIRMALEILSDLIWGLKDTTPGKNVAWMSNLAELVLPNQESFREWREQSIQRLERYYPHPAQNEDAIFSDEISIGPWVPREIFDLSHPFDPSQTHSYVENFVQRLNYSENHYLNTPEEIMEFPDWDGTPYQIANRET